MSNTIFNFQLEQLKNDNEFENSDHVFGQRKLIIT